MSLRCISYFLMSLSTEPNNILCKDLFKICSQRGKAMNCKASASKLTNSKWPISSYTNRKCQFRSSASKLIGTGHFPTQIGNVNLHNMLRSICHIVPEMSDISDQYGNIALRSLVLILHKDRVKTLHSKQLNKLTCCYYAMSML